MVSSTVSSVIFCLLKRVLLMSGGAYLIGAMGSVPFFWWWMRTNLGKKGKSVGFAMLNYSASLFSCDSTPHKSLRLFRIQRLFRIEPFQLNSTKPSSQSNMSSILGSSLKTFVLTGDSAGGLLIHQVFSHMLHPVEGVPVLNLETPFAGAYMMSPWTRLRDPDHKYFQRLDAKATLFRQLFSTTGGRQSWKIPQNPPFRFFRQTKRRRAGLRMSTNAPSVY